LHHLLNSRNNLNMNAALPSRSTDESMRRYYARRASEYEQIYAKPERQEDLQEIRRRAERAFAGADVFEVACGTGYWTEVIARTARSVMATDINEEVLTFAHAKPIDPQKVRFQKTDAWVLAELEQQFDAGFSGFWWSHIPKARLRGFLEGFHKILRPAGRVMFIDNAYVEGSSTPISRVDNEGNTYQRRQLQDGSTHEVLKNFPNETELRAAVQGLADEIQIEFLRYYWILRYRV
jgi:demethylmenaquinone methyltransferase/2-methoxy-6-polyprenyl-1,4-benzoquinol methylase